MVSPKQMKVFFILYFSDLCKPSIFISSRNK